MNTQDNPEERPTIAGRALRALRTGQAPAESAVEPPAVEEEPATDDAKPTTDEAVATEPAVAEPAAVRLDKTPARPSAPLTEPTPAPSRVLTIAMAALVVLALAYSVIGLVVYLKGKDSAAVGNARARDDVVVAARIDIATLNTLDYRSVLPGLQKWLAVTTGSFHDQISEQAKSEASIIAQAKRVTVARVLAAAITDLDLSAGTATVIASVQVTKTPDGGTSAVERNRYRALMKRVDGIWKISELAVVPVGLS